MVLLESKLSTIHLPKREELGFRLVWAFPKDSRIGLAAMMRSAIPSLLEPPVLVDAFAVLLSAMYVRNDRHCFVASVFPIQSVSGSFVNGGEFNFKRGYYTIEIPAPDSPEMRIDWFLPL